MMVSSIGVPEGRSGTCPTDRKGSGIGASVIPLLGLPWGPGVRLGGRGGIRLVAATRANTAEATESVSGIGGFYSVEERLDQAGGG